MSMVNYPGTKEEKGTIESVVIKAMDDEIQFMKDSFKEYFSDAKKHSSMKLVTNMEVPKSTPPLPEQLVVLTKDRQSLKYWTVTPESPVVELQNPKPTLVATVGDVQEINVVKSSKSVSALPRGWSALFAKHIAAAHKPVLPHIVCSGSTLSQIVNWLMRFHSNSDRPLICFEKLDDGSIWAHSLDDGKARTTQPEEKILFSTSVENYLLKDVLAGNYVYASSIIKFGGLNLLTYFEVDGFDKGEPIEIKSQKIGDAMSQERLGSISNSNLFTVKSDNYWYLRYKSCEKTQDSSKYSFTDGRIVTEPCKAPANIDAYLPMLSKILHQVLDILSDADVDAVVLQFIYATEQINIMQVTKSAGEVYDGWKAVLEEAKEQQVKLNAEPVTATDEEKPANELQDQAKPPPVQNEDDGFEQVSYKKKKPAIGASEPKKADQGRSNTNQPKKPQESKSN